MRKRLEEPGLREKIVAETRNSLVNNGGESTIQFRRFSNDPSVEGKTLAEVALERNLDPTDLIIELISVGNPLVVSFSMHEDDIALFMSQSWNMTSSDGGLVEIGEGVPHPRNYGTFPRKIRKYALEENLLEIENAVRSMTSLTSSVFGLFKRGILRPGFKADIAIFDPGKITDKGTYSNPHQLAEGMVYVLVNGRLAMDNFEFTDQFAGTVLHLGQ